MAQDWRAFSAVRRVGASASLRCFREPLLGSQGTIMAGSVLMQSAVVGDGRGRRSLASHKDAGYQGEKHVPA
jgi:hypothetical protein